MESRLKLNGANVFGLFIELKKKRNIIGVELMVNRWY